MNKKYLGVGVLIIVIILVAVLSGKDKNGESQLSSTNGATNTPQKTVPKTSTAPKPSTPTTSTKPAGTTVTPAPSISAPKNIEGSVFRLTNYNGTVIPTTEKYTLYFENGSLSAKFCNNLGGEYVLDKDKNEIVVRNLVSTQMYCGEPSNLMPIESAFGSMIGRPTKISQYGNNLMLNDTLGNTFIFSGFAN